MYLKTKVRLQLLSPSLGLCLLWTKEIKSKLAQSLPIFIPVENGGIAQCFGVPISPFWSGSNLWRIHSPTCTGSFHSSTYTTDFFPCVCG